MSVWRIRVEPWDAMVLRVQTAVDEPAKRDVWAYWEAAPCGAKHAGASPGTAQFFAEVAAARTASSRISRTSLGVDSTAGQKVLEIGVGLGSDHIRFARAGAVLTGVDLTEASIELTRQRLEMEGQSSNLEVADAEALPFPDGYFDVVYSWGVLHHTPDSDRASARRCASSGPAVVRV